MERPIHNLDILYMDGNFYKKECYLIRFRKDTNEALVWVIDANMMVYHAWVNN